MGIFKSFIQEFARETPPQTNIEIGTSTIGLTPSIFDEEFIDLDQVQVADYKKMLDSDGTVQALYNTIVMPLLGSNWTIEPDEDSPAAIEQSAWVEETLRMPPHKGGMTTPFDLVLAQMLRAVVEGYAAFEKVYDLKDGRIVFRKVAWRDPTTVTMRTDDRGGFNGLRQRAFIGSDYVDVKIPVERCFVYTYGKEFHHLKGRSAFTSAYVAYDKKRRLLYLAEQQAQGDAFKIKIVKGKEGANQDELDATTEAVDEVGVRATIGVPYGYDVDTLNSQMGMDLLPFVEFQNAEMARSVLAMFILLGTGSDTGSYSLSQDQSDFFVQALMSIRKGLEQHITSYLLPDLYKYNFEKPEYGTFRFEDITDSTIDLLKQTFVKLTEKDRLPDSIVDGVMQKMADKLDIDVDLMEEAASGVEEPRDRTLEIVPSIPEMEPATMSFATIQPDGWRREPTPAETKVNFAGIENKLNSLEAETNRTLKPIWDELAADLKKKLDMLISEGDYSKITVKLFDENIKNRYVKALKESGLEAYLYGKNGASDELQVKAPQTPKESKDFFRDNAIAVVDKQLSDLIFKVQAKVTEGRRKDQLSTDLSVGDIVAAVGDIIVSYFTDTISLTGSTVVSMGVNKGRKDLFDANADEIYGYQYSALLDNRTCPTCEALDGKVLTEAEYKNTEYDPPIHYYCRCIWVAIMKDEMDPPAYTGFPDNEDVAGMLEPSLSRIEEKIAELSRRAVNDEVTRLLAED